MHIVQRYKCDECNKVIEPGDGFIFNGQIFSVSEEIEMRRGIIVDRLEKKEDTHVFCKRCLVSILDLDLKATPRNL